MVRHSWAICCSRADFNGKMSDSRGRDETPRSINSASQRPQNANHKAHYSGDDCWVGPHWEECSGADHSSRRPTRTIIKSKQKDESLLVHYILPKIFLIISPTDVTLELFFLFFFFLPKSIQSGRHNVRLGWIQTNRKMSLQIRTHFSVPLPLLRIVSAPQTPHQSILSQWNGPFFVVGIFWENGPSIGHHRPPPDTFIDDPTWRFSRKQKKIQKIPNELHFGRILKF